MIGARLAAKRALALPMRAVRGLRARPMRFVLTFHEVGDHPWAVSPERFSAHLDAVANRHAIVPLSTLLAEDLPHDRPCVALTFDDAYAGVARYALPVLERLGATATVFVPTDLLAPDDAVPRLSRGLYEGVPVLGWSSISALAAGASLKFESHGAAHQALPSLSPEARAGDLRRSRDVLSEVTGRPVKYLAYPFGAADEATAQAAADAGYEAAFTTRHGRLRPEAPRHLLPRADVRADYAPKDVLALLAGDWDWLGPVQALSARARRE